MAKTSKTVKKTKKVKKPLVPLDQTQLQELITDLDQFENAVYLALTGTDRFDIIPTTDPSGRLLSKEQLSLIKQECLRLGVKVIYRVELENSILLVNPENMKIGYLTEGSIH